MTIPIQELLQTARTAALEAGAAILQVYTTGDFGETVKTDASPLTRADQAAHRVILQHLAGTSLPVLSEEGIHESYEKRKDWDWYWLIDPLDGTKEFLKRNGEFTVNIALMHQAIPVGGVVYAPVPDVLYYGSQQTGVYKEAQGIQTRLQPLGHKVSLASLLQKPEVVVIASRTHMSPETEAFIRQFRQVQLTSMGSSLKFMLLAENKADVYPRFAPTAEWDTAAAHAILRALGKGVFQADLESELVYNKADLLNPSFVAI
ncbi:3'-5'-bisphosphate nucleotidase [Pontibacter sp. HJ8]